VLDKHKNKKFKEFLLGMLTARESDYFDDFTLKAFEDWKLPEVAGLIVGTTDEIKKAAAQVLWDSELSKDEVFVGTLDVQYELYRRNGRGILGFLKASKLKNFPTFGSALLHRTWARCGINDCAKAWALFSVVPPDPFQDKFRKWTGI
jgi:hypothetical protein